MKSWLFGLRHPTPATQPRRVWIDIALLFGIWALSAIITLIWLRLDHTPPAWDQGDHLSRAIAHWQVLQQARPFDGDWWQTLWMESASKRGPLTYLFTVPFFTAFGAGFDQAVWVNLWFAAVLVGATYATGRRLFSRQVGLWAAGLTLLSPLLIRMQRDYLQDFSMTAVVMVMVMAMTYFWFEKRLLVMGLLAVLWGITAGLVLLNRTSGVFFVLPPIVWMLGVALVRRQWQRAAQVLLGSVVAGLTIWPWFSTGWLMIISTTLESNAYGVVYSDDPQANTLAGWLFYPQRLPELLSWPLLTMAAIAWGLLIVDALLRWRNAPMTLNWLRLDEQRWASLNRWIWPLAFIVGVYFLFTLGTNKRLRFVLPLLPVIWIVLCQGVVSIRHRGWRWGRWLAVGLSFYLTVSQLFVGAARPQYAPGDWPNRSVIGEMVATAPYLRPNLGIAVNTAEVNAFNMNFYGAAANFQVFARQVGLSLETAVQDAQALDWYLTKTGEQGVYGTIEAGQQVLAEAIATSPEMAIQRTWPLPDGSTLNLHHRQQTPITVRPIEPESTAAIGDDPVRLLDVQVAEQIKPGATYPITYTWQGGAALEPGLVLLTWKPESPASTAEQQSDRPVWISDHALGLGYLNIRSAGLTEAQAFEVKERLTLQPPENLPPGPYQLEVTYLNRETGEATAIASDPVRVVIDPQAAAPEREREGGDRDLFTFFQREMAPKLQTGELDPVFFEVGRINQYDPQQDYLNQVEQAMTYRLSQVPNQLDWLYALTLTYVLQQDGPGAIAALETITQVAPDNAYNWLHLGFVYLYSWQPGQARRALAEAERQQPNLPNLALLKTVNAVMGLNIPEAIRLLRSGT